MLQPFPPEGNRTRIGSGADPAHDPQGAMIPFALAHRLRDAGLEWCPRNGDQFFIPDRNLDDRVFSISEMTVDVRPVAGGRVIAFNGTVEWALDAIMESEVVWLPSEGQLRELVGPGFVTLQRVDGRFRCEVDAGGERLVFEHADAAGAYGLAVLHRLEQGRAPASG